MYMEMKQRSESRNCFLPEQITNCENQMRKLKMWGQRNPNFFCIINNQLVALVDPLQWRILQNTRQGLQGFTE